MIPEELLDESASTITLNDVQRVRYIIEGKFVPDPLPISQQIAEFYERYFGRLFDLPFNRMGRGYVDSLVLNWLFPDNVVLTFKTKAGHIAVLCVGVGNAAVLREQLTLDENEYVYCEATTSLEERMFEIETEIESTMIDFPLMEFIDEEAIR